jgi:hypothetical protein
MPQHFYNGTIRKYIIMFGKMFNDIDIVRYNNGEEVQTIRVPIAYGPAEKWLTRLNEDPGLDREVAIQLPRLAFELTSMNYDPSRALNKMTKSSSPSTYTNTVNSQYTPIPYNFNITLSGFFSYQEDAVQVAEQIIPFFRPEWTMSLQLMENSQDYYDIPTVLNNMSMEDTYESDFMTRRAIIYTWDFVVKGYLFGPERNRGVIKRTVIDMVAQESGNPISEEIGPHKKITLIPGQTSSGEATTDPDEAVTYNTVQEEDNWDYAFENEDFFDGLNRHEH